MAGPPANAAPPPGQPAGGRYEMGFQLTPLTVHGDLDTSGDFKGGAHPVEQDTLYNMAVENREGGNKMVQEGQYEMAIGRYSELIMQTRALDQEPDIEWTDEGRTAVRMLRATAYLNLSMCFLKTEQWQHANNTATRALQGDKDPPEAADDVLPAEKKAKALFRRAQAQIKGFSDYQKATDDLKKALEFSPNDSGIKQELRQAEQKLSKASKEADKKISGFLNNAKKDKGLFDEKLQPSTERKQYTEPMKLSDGLWVMPKGEKEKAEEESTEKPKIIGEDNVVNYEELTREINELREAAPNDYATLRSQVGELLDKEITEMERQSKEEASPETQAPVQAD